MSELWTAAAKATQSSLCWSYQELGDGGGRGWAGGDEGQQNGLSQGTGQVCRERGTYGRCQQVQAAGFGG